MIVILAITLLIELALYLMHRAQRDAMRRALERAHERAASRSTRPRVPVAPFLFAERGTDDRRAVIGARPDVGAVWNIDPTVTP